MPGLRGHAFDPLYHIYHIVIPFKFQHTTARNDLTIASCQGGWAAPRMTGFVPGGSDRVLAKTTARPVDFIPPIPDIPAFADPDALARARGRAAAQVTSAGLLPAQDPRLIKIIFRFARRLHYLISRSSCESRVFDVIAAR